MQTEPAIVLPGERSPASPAVATGEPCVVCSRRPPALSDVDGDVRPRALCTQHRAQLTGSLAKYDGWRHDAAGALCELCAALEKSYRNATRKKDEEKGYERLRALLLAWSKLTALVLGLLTAGGSALAGFGLGDAGRWAGVGIALIGASALVWLALVPVDRYIRHRAKSRRYERLIWDVWTYVVVMLDDATRADFYAQMTRFTQLREEAGD